MRRGRATAGLPPAVATAAPAAPTRSVVAALLYAALLLLLPGRARLGGTEGSLAAAFPVGGAGAARPASRRGCPHRSPIRCGPWSAAAALPLQKGDDEVEGPIAASPDVIPVTGVTLKIAVDANGAAGERRRSEAAPAAGLPPPPPSVRFTSPASLDMVHRLRRDSGAVLVGRGTVAADDPGLTVRRNVPCRRQPLRAVLDPRLSLLREPPATTPDGDNYALFRDGLPTVVYHGVEPSAVPEDVPEQVTCVRVSSATEDATELDLTQVLDDLRHRFSVNHVMVEGGPATAQRFLRRGLVDRALVVRAPRVCFPDPATALDAGVAADRLARAGLEYRGSVPSGGDTIECWSRPGLPWPTERLEDWP